MKEWIGQAVDAAGSTLISWIAVMAVTLIVGFCAGYWVGHGEITDASQTLYAFALLPVIWLGNPEMFIAYGVASAALYLPPHYEARWFRIVCAVANLLVWFVVVYFVVVKTSHWKWFHY